MSLPKIVRRAARGVAAAFPQSLKSSIDKYRSLWGPVYAQKFPAVSWNICANLATDAGDYRLTVSVDGYYVIVFLQEGESVQSITAKLRKEYEILKTTDAAFKNRRGA